MASYHPGSDPDFLKPEDSRAPDAPPLKPLQKPPEHPGYSIVGFLILAGLVAFIVIGALAELSQIGRRSGIPMEAPYDRVER